MSDQLLNRMIVGMVNIHCPACGEPIQVDVRVKDVGTMNGSYMIINFQAEMASHSCVGQRA